MSVSVCVDGMRKVISHVAMTNSSHQVLFPWKSHHSLVINSQYRYFRYRCSNLPSPMATTLYRFHPSISRSHPLCWDLSPSGMGITLPPFLHHGPVHSHITHI